jgi:hypothetical protein
MQSSKEEDWGQAKGARKFKSANRPVAAKLAFDALDTSIRRFLDRNR